jgi:CTD kinase subunit alpha
MPAIALSPNIRLTYRRLQTLEGDWHEFESKALRKENEKRDKEARRATQKEAANREKERKRTSEVEPAEREAKRVMMMAPPALAENEKPAS